MSSIRDDISEQMYLVRRAESWGLNFGTLDNSQLEGRSRHRGSKDEWEEGKRSQRRKRRTKIM